MIAERTSKDGNQSLHAEACAGGFWTCFGNEKANGVKAWITKYALTEGIIEVDDADVSSCAPSMISCKSLGVFATFHGEGREWHRSLEEAKARANKMKASKIKSLRWALAKLEAMTFDEMRRKTG